jgi:FkbM family methyltransferase
LNIECPPTMLADVQKVLRGEYEVPYQASRPVILDIGANVGSFAAWASLRWPGCQVHCYEPLPENFKLLRRNLDNLGISVTLHNFAVGNPDMKRLFLGRNNCGEASLYDIGEQMPLAIDVETKPSSVLPPAQIMKVDTEGSEIDILTGISSIDFDVILLEYHSDANRRRADELLPDYFLVGGEIRHLHRGVLKYMHRRLFTNNSKALALGGEASMTR